MLKPKISTLTAASTLVAALALALVGCSPSEQAEAKRETRDAVSQVKEAAREVGADAKAALSDAVITTSIKAELAKDTRLSAVKIDVDTTSGRVALRGTAPSTAAREHAGVLAQSVSGVVGVNNELTVEPGR